MWFTTQQLWIRVLSKFFSFLCFFIYTVHLKMSVFKVLVLPLTSMVLILVKQVAVPPGTTLSTASFSEDILQPTAVTASSGSKDQVKGEDEEKKKKEKVEKKGSSLF